MTLDTLIILTGTFVAILPFLGFPNSWDTVLFLLAGVVTIVLGIIVRRRGHRGHTEVRTYAENLSGRQAGAPGHEA